MRKKIKKILLLFSALLIFVITVYLAYKTWQKESRQPTQAPIATSEINLPEPVSGELPIEIVDKPFVSENIPKEMPLLNFALKRIDKTFSERVAKNLKYQSLPYEIKDVNEGIKYVWATDDFYLWITPKTANIRFGMNQFPNETTDNKLSENEIREIAKKFIVENFEVDENTIDYATTTPLKPSSTIEVGLIPTTKNDVLVYQVSFLYKDAGHVIFTTIPASPTIFVQVLLDGSIYKSEVYLFGDFKSTDTKYPIINPDDIEAYISESRLNALLNDYIDLTNITADDIQNIQISSISLGYFLNETEIRSPLHPVYLLEGRANLPKYRADYAQLYLPAIKPSSR